MFKNIKRKTLEDIGSFTTVKKNLKLNGDKSCHWWEKLSDIPLSKRNISTIFFISPISLYENVTYGVGIGLPIIPFATIITSATGTLIPTKIPAKTKPSLLSIIHQKSTLLFV